MDRRVFISDGKQVVAATLRRHTRARRFLLRINADGSARVTLPRSGVIKDALAFVGRQWHWMEKQVRAKAITPTNVGDGHARLMFRGEWLSLADQEVLAAHGLRGEDPAGLQQQLQKWAAAELPQRVLELAQQKGVTVKRITIRNQRTRWGSCSSKAVISLNWRLVQMPLWVRDYIILHELAHVRHLNHSHRFWQLVETWCPQQGEAKKWLHSHQGLLTGTLILGILPNT